MWAGGAALAQPLPGPSRPRAHAAVAVGGAIVGQLGAGRRGGDDGGAEGLRGSARGVQAHLPHLQSGSAVLSEHWQRSPRVPPARSQRSRFAPKDSLLPLLLQSPPPKPAARGMWLAGGALLRPVALDAVRILPQPLRF